MASNPLPSRDPKDWWIITAKFGPDDDNLDGTFDDLREVESAVFFPSGSRLQSSPKIFLRMPA